ncbi:hypothetical protein [Actinomadura miaoliensis]|uniref:Uncharacterized protein n=1 Tax=Actinomadura miaoliensis TaxID=430685 RepID=A0ABP7UYK8_9ACTN
MAEVVRYAGGWLFDRGMAGWEVNVLTAARPGCRAARILGARVVELEAAPARPVRGPRPRTLAVCTDLYATDERIRDRLLETMATGRLAEVRLFGDRCPEDLDGGVDPVPHRLSAAARTFKAHALAAASARCSWST